MWLNDNEPYAAEWLRRLIEARHLSPGVVNERSIKEIEAQDLKGHEQAHFFAGIGGWPLALQLAGWPSDRPVWTGSCPCQPFSVAGNRAGTTDERHLWPDWFRLIEECRPAVIFGEQVASKDGYAWFDLVQADLEGLDYACGMVVSPAAVYGAPHIRHRIYFVADTKDAKRWTSSEGAPAQTGGSGGDGIMADHIEPGLEGQSGHGDRGNKSRREHAEEPRSASKSGASSIVGDARSQRRQQERRSSSSNEEAHGRRTEGDNQLAGSGETNGFWAGAEWLPCTDGKARPVEPGTFPLAHGVPGRVGRLRAYGNAIVVPQAVEFIRAYIGPTR